MQQGIQRHTALLKSSLTTKNNHHRPTTFIANCGEKSNDLIPTQAAIAFRWQTDIYLINRPLLFNDQAY